MADITYSSTATQRRPQVGIISGKGDSYSLKELVSATIELAASASGTTVKLGTVESSARISPVGLIYNDDLATSGSPTLDIGFGSVDSNVTSDPDALNNNIALSTAGTITQVMADASQAGMPAWEYISGQTEDPKGLLDVYVTVKDAATTTTGTLTVCLYGTLD